MTDWFESIIDVGSGFILAVLIQLFIFPLFDFILFITLIGCKTAGSLFLPFFPECIFADKIIALFNLSGFNAHSTVGLFQVKVEL